MELPELEEFLRIHFVKIRLIKDERRYEIKDNFNQLSFIATIPVEDKRCVSVLNLEPATIFHIVQNTEEEFSVKSSHGQNIGFISLDRSTETNEPIAVELQNPEKELRFKLTKLPLIKRTQEFQITSIETGSEVGRINISRTKAIVSMQPEIQTIHKTRIISTAIILLGIHNQSWAQSQNTQLNDDEGS